MTRKNKMMPKLNDLLILQMIKKYGSVMPLIKAGFSYLDVFERIWTFEREGIVRKEEGDYRALTEEGEKILHELSEKKTTDKTIKILPLSKYKMHKISIDDIFLP